MSRISRESYKDNHLFHIMTQGNNKEKIFFNEKQKYEYISLMEKYYEDNLNLKIIAYCIMDNHAHILIHSEEIVSLTHYIHKVNTAYGIYYNNNLNRVGYVFRDRFKMQVIINKKYLSNCIIYIQNNPVNAGICNCAREYKFSSYYKFIKENKELFTELYNNYEVYEYMHNVHNKRIVFIEDEETREKEITSDIKEYLKLVNKNFGDLRLDNNILRPLVKRIKEKYNLSNAKIGRYLMISKEKIRYILK